MCPAMALSAEIAGITAPFPPIHASGTVINHAALGDGLLAIGCWCECRVNRLVAKDGAGMNPGKTLPLQLTGSMGKATVATQP